MDPPECNAVQTEVNKVQIAPKCYSLMQWTHTPPRESLNIKPILLPDVFNGSNGCTQVKVQPN